MAPEGLEAEKYMPTGSGNRKCASAAVSRPIGMSVLIPKPRLHRPQAVEIMLRATGTSSKESHLICRVRGAADRG